MRRPAVRMLFIRVLNSERQVSQIPVVKAKCSYRLGRPGAGFCTDTNSLFSDPLATLFITEASMILRKIADAVQEQSWFTVVLEF